MDHPSDRLAAAVEAALGERIKADANFAANVWGALVYNDWFDAEGIEGILTYRGADSVIQDIRRDGESFYMEGGEGPPPPEIAKAMAAAGWLWRSPELPKRRGKIRSLIDWLLA